MKTCKECNQDLPLSDFKSHSTNKDKLTGKCKPCLFKLRKIRESKNEPTVSNKVCRRCWLDLPSDKFTKNKTVTDGLNGWCKSCEKDSSLNSKYNISLEDYNRMLGEQGYRCKLCFTDLPGGRRNTFVVDHDHKSGNIRGLLCNHCNTGIGKLHDDPQLLRRAAKYVESSGVLK